MSQKLLPDAAALRQLDLMFGCAPFGIAYLDAELRLRWTNPAYAALSGSEPEELRGRALDTIYPDLDAEVDQLLRAVLSGERASGEYLVRRRTEHGADPQAHQMVVFAVSGADALPHGLMVMVREATAEVEASAQLAIATQRLRLLSDLGGRLSAILDLDRLVALAIELLSPLLGDACAVEVGEDDPDTPRVFRAVSVPGREQPATTTVGPPSKPVRQAVEAGKMVRYPVVPAGFLGDSEGDRPGQTLVVPMHARDQVVGAVILARFGSHRTYESDEIALAVEAADRIGMAVDNARLFARQRDAAVTLQHTLLPQRLPDLPGVDAGARYLAGSAEVGVGGDWFDLTPLPDGTLGLVIGDVMGRGIRAAAIMGQLRAAVRAYAVLGLTPSRLLAYLDRVVTSLDQVQLVTCLYGVLDPAAGTFTYAEAGHHPPLVRHADGSVHWLRASDSPPLGVLELGSGPPAERIAHIPPGATLLLYTDGLVEERHTDLGVRERQLADSFSRAAGRPERVVDDVLTGMGRDGDHQDDIALLAVHLPTEAERRSRPPGQQAQLTVTGEPGSVAGARHFLSSVLDDWGLQPLIEGAALLVSEVVTNALLHARSGADVHVQRTSTGVEVEVRDLDERLPAARLVDDDAESGRGLFLLDAVASDWGAEPSAAGKRVWFRLDLPGDP